MLLVIGTDDALLEGLAQALASTGQRVATCHTLDEAAQLAHADPPLMLIVDSALVRHDGGSALERVAVSAGGALVTFHTAGTPASDVALPRTLARLQMADLELPLERNRLLALAEHLGTRARLAGRARAAEPKEPPSA